MRQQPEKEDLAPEFASGLKKSRSDTFQFERNLPFLAGLAFRFFCDLRIFNSAEYSGSPTFTLLTTDSMGLIQTRHHDHGGKVRHMPENLDMDPRFSCRLAAQSPRFMGLRERFVL
jgi:hypothetical protein